MAEPFDIDVAMGLLRTATAPFPKAAMFELAEEGYSSLFEQLVACVISVRTRDETTLPIARRLFARARTPDTIDLLAAAELAALIEGSSFHWDKARNIRSIAERALTEFDGNLPCDDAVLRSLPGIGPKCANLALGVACGQPRISVDIHVHRVTNRWGYVHAATPERTMEALERVLPERYAVEINKLLVPFGKHVCTGQAPHCSTCLLADTCQRVGVTTHR